MGFRRRMLRAAAVVEVAVERVFHRGDLSRLLIEPYHGYATPDHLVVRGRVLAARDVDLIDGASRLANARQMMRMFATHEVANVTVASGNCTAISDAEGYFTLLLPRPDADVAGWVDVPVTIRPEQPVSGIVCPVLVTRPDARYVVISDIDDTMMHTGAWSMARNLWTSLTGSVVSRVVFPDAVRLIVELGDAGRNPVFFVSSSPWNFHAFLDEVFGRAGLPRAPKFLRDYGFGADQFLTGNHGDHKGSAIDRILAAHPGLPAVLIGDTGQQDATIYADAAVRHPGRIGRVILRTPGPGPDAMDLSEVERLRGLTVPVTLGPDFTDALAAVRIAVSDGV
ncbi:Phosphatidate phosphatase APP1 [Loktanella fryxellensis]|uniref:Phosphatidate phosphatase APP1 n=1 Tax=Loktanella fryxellensis TaxID=245187 RepID=A0A1H8DP75_9RHOB|nr:phosphatase domain-containing protein [Loktanella fryxellensis]SEN09040.1 Phosphatidate phosphatase APP1 [Loktanella fryxellensis]